MGWGIFRPRVWCPTTRLSKRNIRGKVLYDGKTDNTELLTYKTWKTTIWLTGPPEILQSPPDGAEDTYDEKDLKQTLREIEQMTVELRNARYIEAEIR